jgi:hypothetical protein
MARSAWTIAANTPALNQRWLCGGAVCQGGRCGGLLRPAAPARTLQRR